MNNKQYIKALEKALMGLDKENRDEILMEIKSHIEELGDEQSLESRFGSATELAKKYLEGEQTAQPLPTRVVSAGKKVMNTLGIVALLLIAIVGGTVWWLAADSFDYANENAPELATNQASWQEAEWGEETNVNVEQSEVVFYWHEDESVRWDCEREITMEEGYLAIRQNRCLVFLPSHKSSIDVDQGGIVVVRPIDDVSIKVHQSALRIAENGAKYRYELSTSSSKVESFISHDNADVTIAINARGASISHY